MSYFIKVKHGMETSTEYVEVATSVEGVLRDKKYQTVKYFFDRSTGYYGIEAHIAAAPTYFWFRSGLPLQLAKLKADPRSDLRPLNELNDKHKPMVLRNRS